MNKKRLNITHSSGDWRVQQLSNFTLSVFEIDGVEVHSVESFLNGILIPFSDRRRYCALRMHGIDAQLMTKDMKRKLVWWKGDEMKFNSAEHKALMEKAIRNRLRNDNRALAALAATQGLELMHKPPKNDPRTIMGGAFFCKTLMMFRARFVATGSLKPR